METPKIPEGVTPETEADDIIKSVDDIGRELDEEMRKLRLEQDFKTNVENMKILLKLEQTAKEYEKAGEVAKAKKTRQVHRQLTATKDLHPLDSPDLAVVLRGGKKAVEAERKKRLHMVREKLRKNKRYNFVPPETLRKSLAMRLPEGRKNYSDLFLDLFFEFILKKSLKEWAVFVTATMTAIFKFKYDEYDHELLQQIVELVEKHYIDEPPQSSPS
jgi:hypothetical protein